MTSRFALFAEVQRVALFGSVARPLAREVPRFQSYRRLGIELLHECKDVDLAVWITDLAGLRDLGLGAQPSGVADRHDSRPRCGAPSGRRVPARLRE